MAREIEPLLTPAEVATLFRVHAKTVTRWAATGKIRSVRTLGGHRRYREAEVRALLAGEVWEFDEAGRRIWPHPEGARHPLTVGHNPSLCTLQLPHRGGCWPPGGGR